MGYKIKEMGQKFLAAIEIKKNYKEFRDTSIKIESLADFAKVDGTLDKEDVENSFYFSVYNPFHYPRMAKEIMEKLFTSTEKSELQKWLADLGKEDVALITSADSAVKETIRECRKGPFPDVIEKDATEIVCKIFEEIPSCALNLLGLIKIKPEHFPQSYVLFERMLKDFNGGIRNYDQPEIKGIFTKALKELETWVGKVKKKKLPPEQSQSEPTEQNPPREKENTPDNSKKNPQKQKRGPENNQNPNEKDNPATNNLATVKNEAISAVKAALNQTPPLTNSDLSSQYQDWENRINNLSEEGPINLLKNRVLDDIQDQRTRKIKKTNSRDVREIINSNLQNAQRPESTIQDKEKALANSEKYEGQVAYEDTKIKEKTKNLKKEIARAKFAEYRSKVISALDAKLKRNYLKKEELDEEIQTLIEKLRKQKITDPSQLVETEIEITQAIFKQGATKKIITFKKRVKKVLKSNDKAEINKLKKELNEFVESNNFYYQVKKQQAMKLLKRLESGVGVNDSYSSTPLPFAGQIGIGLGVVLAVAFLTFLIWKKADRHLSKHLNKNLKLKSAHW